MDAKAVLMEHKGVFLDQDCLFVSTAEARPGVPKLLTGYVNCEVIYPYYPVVQDLVQQLMEPFVGTIDGFVCPATGDIVLAQYATFIANLNGYKTVAVWADKTADNDYRIERNGFVEAIRGKRVLVINDRISNGGTTLKVVAEARRHGSEVVGVASLSSITAATAEMLGVPRVHTLAPIDVKNFAADEIPEEYRGLPIVIDEPLGHGAEFKEHHPDYDGGWVELLKA